MVSGSGAFVECCRAVWCVSRDDSDDTRYFAPVKFNYGYDPTSVSYRIAPPAGKVEVLETDLRKSAEEIADEIAAAKKAAAGRPSKVLIETSRWLSDLLDDGEKAAKEIYCGSAKKVPWCANSNVAIPGLPLVAPTYNFIASAVCGRRSEGVFKENR